MTSGDTIAAVATAPGRGGVAVVRVSGPDAFAVAARVTGRDVGEGAGGGAAAPRAYRAVFRSGAVRVDDGILLVFRAPHSYTGEDVVEFQGHGGAIAPRRVLEAALAAGARLARRGEFTERAFLNGRLDYAAAESVIDLIDAKTVRAADAAVRGLSGEATAALRALYGAALDLSSEIEHSLDVDEGELPVGFADRVAAARAALGAALDGEIRRAKGGRILREGALVVLAGPPNAGKSSLMNALLGEARAIVSDTPGTTRDSIEEWLDVGGWPVRLVDTAGVRGEREKLKGGVEGGVEVEGEVEVGVEEVDEIEWAGIRRAKELIARADVVLELAAGSESRLVVEPSDRQSVLRLSSKCDLARGPHLNVSAVTGEGLDALRAAVAAALEARAEAAGEAEAGDRRLAALVEARLLLEGPGDDLVLVGNAVRSAAARLGAELGATYSDDLLDRLFSRFCVGK